MKTRIAIADDHAIVRDGIRLMCISDDSLEMSFEAASVEAFLKMIPKNPIDIAIVDIQLPDGSGIVLCEKIKASCTNTEVLIFSGSMEEETIINAVKAGASGYVSKDASLSELKSAISAICCGEQYFSMSIGKILYESYLRKQSSSEGMVPKSGKMQLSARELEVLTCFTQGMSYKEIAETLFISTRTVETHKENIMKKLDLQSTADMIRYALREGIISL